MQSSPLQTRTTSPLSRIVIMATVACIVIALDHLTKWLVATNIPLGQSIWPHAIVSIDHIVNTGAAWSLLPQLRWLYLAAALLVSIYLFYVSFTWKGKLWQVAILGLIVGGAISNGIDRLFAGYVVDFIDVHFWPVFNVADSSIVIGIVITVVMFTMNESKHGREATDPSHSKHHHDVGKVAK